MGQPAFVTYPRIEQPTLGLIHGGGGRHRQVAAHGHQIVFFLALILAATQLADAYLTYKGLSIHGLSAEGNPIVRSLCAVIGIGFGVVVAKLFSIFCITVSCLVGKQYRWMPYVLGGLIAIHVCAAIIPWSYLLFV